MKPAPFSYHRPSTVDEAVDTLVSHNGDAKILAGGQSLIPLMNTRLAAPETLIDINGIGDLDYIRIENEVLSIGALTRQSTAEQSDVVKEHCPLLPEALAVVGHRPIRNRGTIGGNLAHADPTSELPGVALALEAEFVIQGSEDERIVPADEFFVGMMTTAVGADELLTEVRFPTLKGRRGWAFEEMAHRHGDWAVAGVAATLGVRDGECESARLAYTAVDDRPIRVTDAEEVVIGEQPTEDTFATAGEVAQDRLDPPSDILGSSTYRGNLVEALTTRALSRAANRAGGS